MAEFKNPRNSSDSSVIDSVALGLATLATHGIQAREIERLVQQVSLARKQSKGDLAELLWATENFLSSITANTLTEENGSYDVLRDLSNYLLHSSSPEKNESSPETEEVDELLERLDFLASGGSDRDIPKRGPKDRTSRTKFAKHQFPVEPSPLLENPWLISSLEKARSTYRLLVSDLKAHVNPHSLKLMDRQLQHLKSMENQILGQSCIPLAEFRARLTSSFNNKVESNSSNQGSQDRNPSEASGHIFRSLANFLAPVFEDWMKCLIEITADRPQSSFEFKTLVKSEELILSFSLKGIKSKHAELLNSTVESVGSIGDHDDGKKPDHSNRGTAHSAKFQSSLRALIETSQCVAGSLVVETNDKNEIFVEVSTNLHTRLAQWVPVAIGTSRYAFEAHLVSAIFPTSIVSYDPHKNSVAHNGISFEYETLGLAKRMDQVASIDSGFVVLLDCGSRKLAVHVDDVFAIETAAVRQSSSQVEYGNTMLLWPSNLLQLDPHLPESVPSKPSNFKRKSLCLIGANPELVDTFRRATVNADMDCTIVDGVYEAIRSIQERTPCFLVVQSSDGGLSWLDQLQLASKDIDTSNIRVLIVTPDHTSARTKYKQENLELKWISEDIPVQDLAELLASNPDSEEFS
ncbi:MAG: hypothetical protein OXG24_10065 [Gammaproteobacteria bacterium]|nr:hypothetical protein [Gammaproteobacteria bacterium]